MKLGPKAHGIESVPLDPKLTYLREGVMVANVKDPDGNWIELYHHPKPIGSVIPEGY